MSSPKITTPDDDLEITSESFAFNPVSTTDSKLATSPKTTAPDDYSNFRSKSFSFSPTLAIWQQDDWKDAKDILEDPKTETWREEDLDNIYSLESSPPNDDPHNIRKTCRKNARLTAIVLGLMMGVILLGISASSRSKPTALNSLKESILVPQASNDLSELCSPSRTRYQGGLAACQHACEVASCCMEEDEELNCMNTSENAKACLGYSACMNVLEWGSSCEHPSCLSCLSSKGCVWAEGACHNTCPQFDEKDGDIFGNYSPCYFLSQYPDTPEDICRKEHDEREVQEPCEWETDCGECLRCNFYVDKRDQKGEDITCKWILDPSGGGGRCQSSCSAVHGCGVKVCPT